MAELGKVGNEIAALSAKLPPGLMKRPGVVIAPQPASEEEAKTRQELAVVTQNQKSLGAILSRYHAERISALVGKLEHGELVAQGFVVYRKRGSPPVDIPKEEWRLLRFDTSVHNLERAFARDLEYVAVRIAKPA